MIILGRRERGRAETSKTAAAWSRRAKILRGCECGRALRRLPKFPRAALAPPPATRKIRQKKNRFDPGCRAYSHHGTDSALAARPHPTMATKTDAPPEENKVTAARNKNLDLAIQQIAKDFGEGAIMRLGD